MKPSASINRRQAVRRLGALTIVPVLARMGPGGLFAMSGHHPHVPVQEGEPSWAPVVFDAEQTETVAVLVDLIIPETETPGARAVHVHQHIDYSLSLQSREIQQRFLRGLAWLDAKSRETFGAPFVGLPGQAQKALLTIISSEKNTALSDRPGVEFFMELKDRTIVGYYSSEAGMFDELEYQGNDFLNSFPGCTHPEHLEWEPS